MNMHGIEIGAPHTRPIAPPAGAHGAKKAGKGNETVGNPEIAQARDNTEVTEGPEKQKGVVRLLQEGHFKGVADVRLRINFHEELTAIEHQGLAQVVQEEVPGILQAVNEPLDALLASGELTEEQGALVSEAQTAFNASVQQSADDFLNGNSTDTTPLFSDIQSAFDSLVEALAPLVVPSAPITEEVPPAEEGIVPTETAPILAPVPVAVDADSEPKATEPSYLDDVSAGFTNAVEHMRSAISDSSVMPELSEPSGNGVAYEKFLAMYNEMRGISGVTTPGPDASAIDTVT